MNLTYDEIVRELNIFARPYSQYHLNYSKWRSYNAKATEVPDQPLSLHEIEDKTYALIYRPALTCFEAFQFDSITKRTSVKRNEFLYKELTALWKLINPFHLPGISRHVYLKFFEFIHFSVLNTNAAVEEFNLVSKVDLYLDFGDGEVLNFIQFIDCMFECIDAYARSMLVNEYCRIVKRLGLEVKRSSWIKNVDLHTKLNCEGLKPVFPFWANFRTKVLETPLLTTRTYLLTPTVNERLTTRSLKKERKYFDHKMMKYTSPWETRNKFKTFSFAKSPDSAVKKQKPQHSRVKTDLISPLSKKQKTFKDKKIIEEVVKDREERPSNIHVNIIRTPLRYLI